MNFRKWIRDNLGTWDDFLFLVGILIGVLTAPFYLLYLLIRDFMRIGADKESEQQ